MDAVDAVDAVEPAGIGESGPVAPDSLRRRVALLDQGVGGPSSSTSAASAPLDALTGHFIRVMREVVGTGSPSSRPAVPPAEADRIMDGCRLLHRLDDLAPQLSRGPLDLGRQYWIATGKPSYLPAPDPVLSESSFRPFDVHRDGSPDGYPDGGSDLAPSPKPFGVGLFTATGVADGQGMWRRYLDLDSTSSLHPKPWRVWHAPPRADARVYEVDGASAWAELLARYPVVHEGAVYPDWAAIADDYDAVHLTLRVVAAVQGVSLATARGPSAAAYWDVESTLWLSWCFTGVELIDTVGI